MPIRAIFFDAGDTLVHKWMAKAERFAWLCRGADVPLPPDPASVLEGARAQERFFQDRRLHADAWSPAWYMRMNRTGLAAAGLEGDLDTLAARISDHARRLPHSLFLDPEAIPLLTSLRARGYRLAVVSNWDGSLVDQLRPLGLGGWFEALLDSDVCGCAKPDPEIFRIACTACGVQPDEALHVGDSPGADVAGALAAGVRPVLFDPLDLFGEGFHLLPQFERIQRLSELPALLDA